MMPSISNFPSLDLHDFALTYGIKFIGTAAIFVIGRIIARGITKITLKFMRKAKIDDTLSIFTSNILYGLFMTFVVISALGYMGIQTASFVAILGAAGLAIGLALQGSLSNFAAGVMIILFRPFHVGDHIEAAGTQGTVNDLNIFTTRLSSSDGKTIIVPNAKINDGIIINHSRKL